LKVKKPTKKGAAADPSGLSLVALQSLMKARAGAAHQAMMADLEAKYCGAGKKTKKGR